MVTVPPFDRVAHRRNDLDFLEARLSDPTTLLVPVWREQTLVDADGLVVPRVAQAGALVDRADEIVFLGMRGDAACFAVDVSSLDELRAQPGLVGTPQDLRAIGVNLPADEAGLAAYARALCTWHRRQRYCGVCGHETRPRAGGHLRVCARPDCQTEHFPRTDPAVLVVVHDGDRCLVGRQRKWPAGMYSALAGFVEPGETLEGAVVREVAEETGVVVDDVRYAQSQPWPFPASLMLGFTARARSSEIRLDDELEDARWMPRERLLAAQDDGFFVPGPYSLAGRLLREFAERGPAGL